MPRGVKKEEGVRSKFSDDAILIALAILKAREAAKYGKSLSVEIAELEEKLK